MKEEWPSSRRFRYFGPNIRGLIYGLWKNSTFPLFLSLSLDTTSFSNLSSNVTAISRREKNCPRCHKGTLYSALLIDAAKISIHREKAGPRFIPILRDSISRFQRDFASNHGGSSVKLFDGCNGVDFLWEGSVWSAMRN